MVAILSFEAVSTNYQKKETNKYKEKLVILKSIGIIIVRKLRKQGWWSPALADILMRI